MARHWTGIWRGLELSVELRELAGDGGSTLRLTRAGGTLEWLRFDCFDRSPHWHLDPSGLDEVQPLDERGDIFAEVFERLEANGAELLERAGADPATVTSF